MVKRDGGSIEGNDITIKYQKPVPVPLEIGFEGIFPVERKRIGAHISNQMPELSVEFKGCGFVISGRAVKESNMPDAVLEVDVFVNGQLIENAKLPTQYLIRRNDVTWKYDLPEGENRVSLKASNIPEGYRIETYDLLVYSTKDPGIRTYY